MRAIFLGLAFSTLASLSCSASPPPSSEPLGSPPAAAPSCAKIIEAKARLAALLSEGKLDRALRVMQRAESACPNEAPHLWADHVRALALIGRTAEARALALRIEGSDRAGDEAKRAAAEALKAALDHEGTLVGEGAEGPVRVRDMEAMERAGATFRSARAAAIAGDHRAAKDLFVKAWREGHPFPQALVEAGMAARAMGDAAEAQRLWDRAAHDDPSAPVRPELDMGVPVGLTHAEVVFSPSGKKIAVASDGVITVLAIDRATGVDRVSLTPTHRIAAGSSISALAFSGGEELLYTATEDGALRVYDLGIAAVVGDLKGHRAKVTILALAPEGKRLASVSDDGTIRLWDSRTGATIRVLPLKGSAAIAIAWSADGKLLAWSDAAGAIVIWNAETGLVEATADARAPVQALAFAASGQALVMTTRAAILRVDLDKLPPPRQGSTMGPGKPPEPPRAPPPKVISREGATRTGAVSGEGKALVARAHGASLALREVGADGADKEGVLGDVPFDPGSPPLGVALSRDGSQAALVFRGRVLKLVTKKGELIGARAPGVALGAAAASKDVIAAAGADGRALVLKPSAPPGKRFFVLESKGGAAHTAAIAPDQSTLAVGYEGGAVDVWDLDKGALRRTLRTGGAVASVVYSPNGRLLAAGDSTEWIRLWDGATDEGRGDLHLKRGPVRAVRFSPDGKSLLSSSRDGVTVWDVGARQGLRYTAFGTGPRDAAFTLDGAGFAVASSDASVLIGEIGKPNVSRKMPLAADAAYVSFRGDGAIVVIEGDRAIVTRSKEGKILQRFTAPEAPLSGLVVLPSGPVLAPGTDGKLSLFLAPKEAARATIRLVPGAPAAIVVSEGGYLDLLGDDVSPAKAMIRCRLGMVLYPFEVCAEQFWVSGLVPMVLRGADPAEAEP